MSKIQVFRLLRKCGHWSILEPSSNNVSLCLRSIVCIRAEASMPIRHGSLVRLCQLSQNDCTLFVFNNCIITRKGNKFGIPFCSNNYNLIYIYIYIYQYIYIYISVHIRMCISIYAYAYKLSYFVEQKI